MKKTLLAIAIAVLMAAMPAAYAQWVVIDPSNLAQNIMTAAHTLEQINNQIRQLQNEEQMLVNQARQLKSLDYNTLSKLLSTLSTTNQLISQAQGLTFNVSQAQATFARLYPSGYSASTTGKQMALDASERWADSLASLQSATQMQSQAAQNLLTDQDTLSELVNQSQSATGQLQATQAGNQLLALLIRQLLQAQQLQLSQDRTAALTSAQRVATEARSQAIRARFLGSGTPYTPQTVNFYGN